MKKLFAVVAALFLLAVIACTSSGGGDDTSTPAASKKAIHTFSLGTVSLPGAFVATINEAEKTIAVIVPLGTDVTALMATFTTTGVSVSIDSTVQISGVTPNDFTHPVVYTVTAVDATTQDYTVTVTIGDVNQPATAISVSMSPNNPSTATSSITGSYIVTDLDGGSVIVTEWYDNGILRQTNTKTLASGVTSGTDTLSGPFIINHTITFKATADGVPSNTVSATVTAPGTTTYSMSGTIHVGSDSGAALSGATVSIAGKTYTTSSSGTFTLTDIAAGTYAFTVSKSGYDTYTNSAYYVGSNQTGLNFHLTQTVTPPSGKFPIGTWVGPNNFKFTISKLISSGTMNQYSGIVYYPSLKNGSINVSGTDSLVQIMIAVSVPYEGNDSIYVLGGETAGNYTQFQVSISGSPTDKSWSGNMQITSNNSAYNYFNMNADFTRQ